MDAKKMSETIKAKRLTKKVTLAEVAKAVGKNPTYVAAALAGGGRRHGFSFFIRHSVLRFGSYCRCPFEIFASASLACAASLKFGSFRARCNDCSAA